MGIDRETFEEQNVLAIIAGMDPELHKYSLGSNDVNITVYKACTELDASKEYEYHMFLLPVPKSIKDINVKVEPYPDRLY